MTDLFQGNFQGFLFGVFIRLIVVFTALPIHEFAHGWVAYKLGDPTAKNQGRLDLNPIKHFDLFGTTALLLTGYGWAKPVPINPYYFKNRKKGMALTALAGPVSNIIVSTLLLLIWKLVVVFLPNSAFDSQFVGILSTAINMMISINIGLAVFNLIPIPPLDGSRVLGYFLPDHVNEWIYQHERYIMFGLFAVIMFTPILDYPISVMRNFLYNGIDFLTGFVDLLYKLIH